MLSSVFLLFLSAVLYRVFAWLSFSIESSDPFLPSKRTRVAKLDEFEVLSLIGRGGYGSVYLVRDKITSHLFALKVIERQGLCQSALAAIHEEQRIQRSINVGGHLLPLEASWQDLDNFYFLLEYCSIDLSDQIFKDGGKLPINRARCYAAELLLALEKLHERKIIHRDVKPSNVLLRRDGHVYLADFGLSKRFSGVPLACPSTKFASGDLKFSSTSNAVYEETSYSTRSPCGTKHFTAPEILSGLPYSFEVDIWSWGVTLHKMLTGRVPFGNELNTERQVNEAVLKDDPDLCGIEDDGARDLLERVLEKDPGMRLSVEGIKSHAFFGGIDWTLYANHRNKVPFVPSFPPIPPKVCRLDVLSVVHKPRPPPSSSSAFSHSTDAYTSYDEPSTDFTYVSDRLNKLSAKTHQANLFPRIFSLRTRNDAGSLSAEKNDDHGLSSYDILSKSGKGIQSGPFSVPSLTSADSCSDDSSTSASSSSVPCLVDYKSFAVSLDFGPHESSSSFSGIFSARTAGGAPTDAKTDVVGS